MKLGNIEVSNFDHVVLDQNIEWVRQPSTMYWVRSPTGVRAKPQVIYHERLCDMVKHFYNNRRWRIVVSGSTINIKPREC